MHEVGGELGPAVERLMLGRAEEHDVPILRLYLKQWTGSPVWEMNPHMTDAGREQLRDLRSSVSRVRTIEDVLRCIRSLTAAGMDPL